MSATAVTSAPVGWRPDPETMARIRALPEVMGLEAALFYVDDVVGGTIFSLTHPDNPTTFVFGLRIFASVEPVARNADAYRPRFARYPPGGMVDIVDRLKAQKYVDTTHIFVEGA